MAIEQDTRYIIDSNLTNKGWILDINKPNKNVFFESDILRIFDNQKLKKLKKRPDYVLFDSENQRPIGVIEAKAGGRDLDKALDQAMEYAEILEAPLIFAMNNSYCKTKHLSSGKPLFINEHEVNELVRQKEALEFLREGKNEIYTIPKEVIVSRQELINIFRNLNTTLRGEGLRAGIERLNEFANILFLKLYCENKEENVWDTLKKVDSSLLIETFNNSLKVIEKKYNASVFTELQIRRPQTLREIINKLDKLTLSVIDTDIKGDAFEYFLQQATATSNDLGEYFTPRHIAKTIVNLINPQFKEAVYDHFCGTGGFLTEAFNHIKVNTIINTKKEDVLLKENTVFGREITTNARLGKMNMILHGDGHSGVEQIDSLAHPINEKYDVVITNMPFSQKTDFSHLYENNLAKGNGDGVCLLHCFKAVKKGGRMALVVPEGVLFRKELKNVREFLFNKAKLETVISLPQGCFLPYTGVKTNILYFTECHIGKTNNNIWFFNVRNDGYSLDNNRKVIKENDLRKIDYVDFKRKPRKQDILEIGFESIDFKKIENNNFDLRYNQYQEPKEIKNSLAIGSFIKLRKGKNPSVFTERSEKTLPYLNVNFFEKRNTKHVISSKNLLCIDEGEVLIIADGQRAGMVFLSSHGVVASTLYVIENHRQDIIDNIYLYLYLKQQFSYLNSNKYGSAIPHLDKKIFLNIAIPLMPMNQQQELKRKYKIIQQKKEEILILEKEINNNVQNGN